jgi:hypothetical protein
VLQQAVSQGEPKAHMPPLLIYVSACLRTHATHALKEALQIYVSACLRTYETRALE